MENMALNKSFWSGKRVFLTGHTGFKGSWLSLWLQSLGATITGFSLAPHTQPNLFEIAGISKEMRSIIGDVRDANAVRQAMADSRPDVVIHMAAQALVRTSYDDPASTYSTNVMGLVHVLDAIRLCPEVRSVVIVTSDKCYENKEWHWGYREVEAVGGYDPYSSSKGCAELVTAAYRNSFFNLDKHEDHGVAIATARAGNVIGGGDWAADRLIPDILRAIEKGEPVSIRRPDAIRPWQHVLEPLNGYLMLAERLYERGVEFAEPWNFGPHDTDAKPVRWIMERMARCWGPGAVWAHDDQPQPHEATYLKLDCSKAHNRLGWQPRWDVGQALERIVHWHQAYLDGADMNRVTLDQIDAHGTSTKLELQVD